MHKNPPTTGDSILIFKSVQEFITLIRGYLTGNAINSDTESFAYFPPEEETVKKNISYSGYYVYIPKSVTDLQHKMTSSTYYLKMICQY
ncbi:hypothetical protein ABK040_015084 [Willaertia magna]